MNLSDHLRQLADALPSDRSAVTFTRADLLALVERAGTDPLPRRTRDLTVEEVAEETQRAPSTVRGWLISGALDGYKLNGRDWRITAAALRRYLEGQQGARKGHQRRDTGEEGGGVDIGAWRRGRGS